MSNDDEKKPHLRLAVENDQREIDHEQAKRDIEWPLRDLAANIIRVVRGAGKSYEIASQCVLVLKVFQQYRDRVGCWPSSWEIDEALSIRRESENPTYDDAWEREHARDTIIRGALQVTASRLVGQNTQEQRGRSEMMDGVRELEHIREEARKRMAEAERAQRQRLNPKKVAAKKTSKPKAKAHRAKSEPTIKF
ncbi:hypothetical protein HNQ96_001443 [Aminobacter lissarensis]|uniref:Uncharacterized protein n=1 Tax=Aminobacter carboxidus TaxID=376165 RepID=A0A8E1WBD4_9HYPH|nr:hypothetical protein [Aminobacter lissarensis]MBB6465585.1 hypothetical protein [Aminobacter lissarensis]